MKNTISTGGLIYKLIYIIWQLSIFLLSLLAVLGMICFIGLGIVVFAYFFYTRFFNSVSATFTKRQEIEDVFRGFAQMHNLVVDKGSAFAYPNMSGIHRVTGPSQFPWPGPIRHLQTVIR